MCWPEFATLDWAAQGLQADVRPARDSDLIGITGAFCAIAETGTLMMCSGKDTPAVNSLLPETHIAVVSRILDTNTLGVLTVIEIGEKLFIGSQGTRSRIRGRSHTVVP